MSNRNFALKNNSKMMCAMCMCISGMRMCFGAVFSDMFSGWKVQRLWAGS